MRRPRAPRLHLSGRKKSCEAAVSNFKAFPLKLPSPGSRAHPCLSDFLRLSPSVSLPLSLRALPPGFLSPCIVLLLDCFFFSPRSVLSPFYMPWCPQRRWQHISEYTAAFCHFLLLLNLQCSAHFHIFIVGPVFKRLYGIFSPPFTAHKVFFFLYNSNLCVMTLRLCI